MENLVSAKEVYIAVKRYFDNAGVKYDAIEKNMSLKATVTGEDFPVTLYISVSAATMRAEVFSQLTFDISPERVVDLAMAMNFANSKCAGGKFSLNLSESKKITYDDSAYFGGLSGTGTEFAKQLAGTAFSVVDKFNDSLYAINKGLLSVKEFIAKNQ